MVAIQILTSSTTLRRTGDSGLSRGRRPQPPAVGTAQCAAFLLIRAVLCRTCWWGWGRQRNKHFCDAVEVRRWHYQLTANWYAHQISLTASFSAKDLWLPKTVVHLHKRKHRKTTCALLFLFMCELEASKDPVQREIPNNNKAVGLCFPNESVRMVIYRWCEHQELL